MRSKRKGYILKNIPTRNNSDSLESTRSAESSKCCQIAKVYSHCVNENKIPLTLTFKVPDDVKSLQGPHSVSCGQKGVIKKNLPGMIATVLRARKTRKVRSAARLPRSIPIVMYLWMILRNVLLVNRGGRYWSLW